MTNLHNGPDPAIGSGRGDRSAPLAAPRQRHAIRLGVILLLVVGLAFAIAAVSASLAGVRLHIPGLQAFQPPSDPLLVIHTRTPTPPPVHTPTRTRIVVAAPTRRATLTATCTPAPTPTPAPTQTAAPAGDAGGALSTLIPTTAAETLSTETPALPAPVSTPLVDVVGDPVRLRAGPGNNYDVVGTVRKGDTLHLLGRTASGEYWQVGSGTQVAWVLADLAEARMGTDQVPIVYDVPPTPTSSPTATATPTLTPVPPPAPILVEPPADAVFEDKVRFKFTWYRRLQYHEKFSIYVRSSEGNATFDWWVSERDILDGGGAIHAVPGAFLYEVNSGLGSIPSGEAFWKVSAFDDTPGVKRPVCPWSEERRIVKK